MSGLLDELRIKRYLIVTANMTTILSIDSFDEMKSAVSNVFSGLVPAQS
jgi:hypothetical protein